MALDHVDNGQYIYIPHIMIVSFFHTMSRCDAGVCVYVAYYVPNWLITPMACKTNIAANTATRSPGIM